MLNIFDGLPHCGFDNDGNKSGYPAPILFWLLFVGGAAAEESGRRQWFLSRLLKMLLLLTIKTWRDAQHQLTVLSHVDCCTVPFEKIWRELDFK